MDPLSVIASVVTLLTTSGTMGKGLKELLKLKDAPQCLANLTTEVEDVHIIIEDVHTLLLQKAQLPHNELPSSLPIALKRLKQTLLALESLISYELTVVTSNSNNTLRIDRSKWLRANSKIQDIIARIRAEKLSLASALALLNS